MTIEVGSIRVMHNCEMAHRLTKTPGKCQNIHGHSWKVILTLTGEIDEKGVIVEFGYLKMAFRDFLNTNFDHHLLLNAEDTWASSFPGIQPGLPGTTLMEGEPTTENFAKVIYDWALKWIVGKIENVYSARVEVWETATNCAVYPAEG